MKVMKRERVFAWSRLKPWQLKIKMYWMLNILAPRKVHPKKMPPKLKIKKNITPPQLASKLTYQGRK